MTVFNKKESNPHTRGLKIQTLALVGIAICVFLLSFVGYNMSKVVRDYEKLVTEFDFHLNSHDYINTLQNSSDDMTEQSRLFVVTGELEYMEDYFNIVDNKLREKAKKEADTDFAKMGYTQFSKSLDKALDESNALMDYEIHAMKLMSSSLDLNESSIPDQVKKYQLPAGESAWDNDKKQRRAARLVFGTEYRKQKSQIDADINAAVNSISDKQNSRITSGVARMWNTIGYMIISCVAIALLFAAVFAVIILLVVLPLRNCVKCIEENRPLSVNGIFEFKHLAKAYNSMLEANQQNQARMNFELEHDALTNAYSRLAFEAQKEQLANEGLPIGLLVIDVDHFKEINDIYGHDAGDQALKTIVSTLRHLLRGDDIVARIGGDEFVVILKNIYSYSNVVIGEKINVINQILQNPEDGSPNLSISVGVAFSENGYSEELFKQADTALYEAKTSGRCGYSVYDAERGLK